MALSLLAQTLSIQIRRSPLSFGANKLSAMRGPGDSYSDVILRLANLEAG